MDGRFRHELHVVRPVRLWFIYRKVANV